MSGKFDIGDNFNVFDEWGNYVGKFTPAGSSLENGCLMIVTMIVLWTMGFLIYALIKLIVKGFQEASKGEWGKAIGYWLIPGLLVGAMFFSVLSATVASAVQQHQYQVEDQRAKAEAQNLVSNPPVAVEMWKTKCTASHDECPWGDGGAYNPTYVFIKVTNNWNGKVAVGENEPSLYCNYTFVWYWLSPGETQEFHCVGAANTDLDSVSNVCIGINYEISSYNPMYKYSPRATVCQSIP